MKKWFPAIVCVALLTISGCRPDPDLILQNGASVQEAEPSALEEERTDPGGDSQAEQAEPEKRDRVQDNGGADIGKKQKNGVGGYAADILRLGGHSADGG